MLVNQIVYNVSTEETRIEQVEISDTSQEIPVTEGFTLEEKVTSLEEVAYNLVSTSWDTDYRLCEVEWALEDSGILVSMCNFNLNNKNGGRNNMALSRFEQAKIIILGGEYDKVTLTKQLTRYLERGYLTKTEYDELISMMEAKELVVGE